ncbi:DUF2017 domain-containing protein [Luteococcus peritonei]|uniref:DUF2017 domain-containing protein n=1 Tax=Luteococcus peritonei TaxID=88874 RepID=A0ABW4RVY5_9ACTN
MRGIEREDDRLVIHFDADEAAVLTSTVDQLAELLAEHQPSAALAQQASEPDPFARWEAEFSRDQAPTIEHFDEDLDDEVDPVVRRLFPDAYPDDPAASHDFRRFTQAEQSSQKMAEARIVLDDLESTDRRGRCRVPDAHVQAWLKTLTAVRLALAVRLEISDEISADEAAQRPDDDPRAWLHEIYQWIGWVQESLIDAL